MIRKFTTITLASVIAIAATPSFADDAFPVPDLVTTMTTDFNKGVAEFNPTEILTPKLADAPAAAPAPKVKKKRYAKKRKKTAKK